MRKAGNETMGLKIVSSLGKGSYSRVRYGFGKPGSGFQAVPPGDDGEERSRLVTVALARHLRAAHPDNSPLTLLLLGPSDTIEWSKTEASASRDASPPMTVWDELAAVVDDIQPLRLAETNDLTAANMWEVFGLLADSLEEGDDVVFDITHSFRMFPFLTLLAAAFLRVARRVRVRHIFYGNFIPGVTGVTTWDEEIIDLGDFMRLLDWTTAAERFINIGDGRPLVGALDQVTAADQEGGLGNALGLQAAADSVHHLSQSLMMAQMTDVMDQACAGQNNLAHGRAFPGRFPAEYRPLDELLGAARRSYNGFAVSEPRLPRNRQKNLKAQAAQLRWYHSRQQWMQGITVAQEFLVSYVCYQLRLDMYNVRENGDRGQVTKLLRGDSPSADMQTAFDALPQATELRGLWCVQDPDSPTLSIKLNHIRNAANHAGFIPSRGLTGDSLQGYCKKAISNILAFLDTHPL